MKPVVFLGPSMPVDEARTLLDADFRPPVAQGDVLRAALRRPRAIGIVDGYFDRVPAVWHKEILFALSEGIPVYGAASMGALRAAELAAFGMVGVGQVFAAFAAEELADDDEVAVAHAVGEHGYRAQSDAMVNIRATLAAAAQAGVIRAEHAAVVAAGAKARFYAERSLRLAVREAAAAIGPDVAERLQAWLPGSYVDVKRQDAAALLTALRALGDEDEPPDCPFEFADTEAWQQLVRTVTRGDKDHGGEADVEAVLDEARLADPEAFARLEERALLRVLVGEIARRDGVAPSDDALPAAIVEFRRAHGLLEWGDVEAWLERNDAAKGDVVRLAEQDHAHAWALEATRGSRRVALLDELRRTGDYAGFAQRARAKRRALEQRDLWRVIAEAGESGDPELLAVFDSPAAARRALARERTYRRLTADGSAPRR